MSPFDGFLKNLALQQLLDYKVKEVVQSQEIIQLKAHVASLTSVGESKENMLTNGKEIIRETCDKTRNDMQVAVEEAKLKLDKIQKDFLNKIDQYEKMCKKNFELIQANKNEIQSKLNESNEFIKNNSSEDTHYHLDKIALKRTLDHAHYLLNNLEFERDLIERQMFNECLFRFEKMPFDSNSIGKLIRQNIELYFLRKEEQSFMIINRTTGLVEALFTLNEYFHK